MAVGTNSTRARATRAALEAAVAHHRAGRLDRAERAYRTIIADDPDNPDALNLLGVVAGQNGRPDEAIEHLRHAARLGRRNPLYYYNLGLAYQSAERMAEAVAAFRRALRIKPDHVEALMSLGAALLAGGDLDGAETCCRKALRLAPDDARAHNNMSAVHLALEALDDAEIAARDALRLAPDLAEAHNNLGAVHLAREQLADAAMCFREALGHRPGYAEARNNLGMVLYGLGRLDEALANLRAAVAARPGYIEARINLGTVYRELGHVTDARATFEAVLEQDPDHLDAAYGVGAALIDAGEIETALARHRAIAPRDPNRERALNREAVLLEMKGRSREAYDLAAAAIARGAASADLLAVHGRLAPRFDATESAIARIETAIAGGDLEIGEHRLLRFTLGRLHDQRDAYDDAFVEIDAANALRPTAFDPATVAATVDEIIAFFAEGAGPASRRAGNHDRRPLFIVGLPRSGTSLVEQILAAHPAVHGGGERDDIPHLMRRLSSTTPFPACLDGLGTAELDALAGAYLDARMASAGDAALATDKLPYNFLLLGLIARLLPGARIIHCRRDPLDTGLSAYFQLFARGNPQTYDLGHLGAYHIAYARLMDHWRRVLDPPMLEIAYEDVVADLEGAARRLVDFAGLAWDDRCLRFHQSERVVNTASFDQVRQPIYTRSVGRWRHYERHLGPLREALAARA